MFQCLNSYGQFILGLHFLFCSGIIFKLSKCNSASQSLKAKNSFPALPHNGSESLYDKNNDTPYIKNECMKILPEYQIPDKFIFIEEFPTNNSGKICKKTLKEMYLN